MFKESVMDISTSENKSKIALIVVGYNRLKSIKRLLYSLQVALYPNKKIPLVISIDASGDEELYDYVREYKWEHGDKYVFIQKKRLGLKKHILKCGDLSLYFKAIVLFEDDIYVSPYFFNYVERTIEKYQENDEIAQISLYSNETNGYVGQPFVPLHNGSDVFLMQDVSTWGECWTRKMWSSYRMWLKRNENFEISLQDIPEPIKHWEKAWSKDFISYVVSNHKYIVFPYESLTTNFSDAGTHEMQSDNRVQVNLLNGPRNYNLLPLNELVKYDIFFNNEYIYGWLGINKNDLCLDLYGQSINPKRKKYLLTTKKINKKVVKTFGLKFRPIELNIKNKVSGQGIFLYDTNNEIICSNGKYTTSIIKYYLKGFNGHLLLQIVIREMLNSIKRKLWI